MLLIQGKQKAGNVCDRRIAQQNLQLRGCMLSPLQIASQVWDTLKSLTPDTAASHRGHALSSRVTHGEVMASSSQSICEVFRARKIAINLANIFKSRDMKAAIWTGSLLSTYVYRQTVLCVPKRALRFNQCRLSWKKDDVRRGWAARYDRSHKVVWNKDQIHFLTAKIFLLFRRVSL
jgi:hypothetical protein